MQPRDTPGRGVTLGGCGSGAYSITYAAAVAEIEVNKTTGDVTVQHIYTAQDYGLGINPDLVENQATGMAIQAVSRLLKEEVQFDQASVASLDWGSSPILRFKETLRSPMSRSAGPTSLPLRNLIIYVRRVGARLAWRSGRG